MKPSQTNTSLGTKIALGGGLIIVSAIYAVWQSAIAQPAPAVAAPSTQTVTATTPTTPVASAPPPTPSPTPTPTSVPTPTPKPTGQYVDGTYTGPAEDAYFGTVQVEAIISGGKLADVKFLQYPNDRGTSREINAQAMPQLTSEAVQAQSAQVNGVSSASQTSAAFIKSLSSALAQAKA